MSASEKSVSSDGIKRKISLLKQKLAERKDLSPKEELQIASWLDLLAASPFGCCLLQNKHLERHWVNFYHTTHPGDLLLCEKLLPLKEMRARYELVKRVAFELDLQKKTVGVYPGTYADEWGFLAYEIGSDLISLRDVNTIFQNEQTFDLVIQNHFLYGALYHLDALACLFSSIKPGGHLLLSVWTNPTSHLSTYTKIDVLFEDLLHLCKGDCMGLAETKTRLRKAGFEQIQIFDDHHLRLRTVLARKPDVPPLAQIKKQTYMHLPRRRGKKAACCKNLY